MNKKTNPRNAKEINWWEMFSNRESRYYEMIVIAGCIWSIYLKLNGNFVWTVEKSAEKNQFQYVNRFVIQLDKLSSLGMEIRMQGFMRVDIHLNLNESIRHFDI